MTALTEPFPPWLRDLNRFFNPHGTVSAFYPPADVLVDDDGVTVFMDVPGIGRKRLLTNGVLRLRIPKPESLTSRRIEIKGGDERRQLESEGR